MGSSPKTPDAPDYQALAAQDAYNQQVMLHRQTVTNRPNQQNQQGSLTWQVNPETGEWTQTEQLSPQMQDLWNQAYQGSYNTGSMYNMQQQDVAGIMNRPDPFQGQAYGNYGINSGTYYGADLGMGQYDPMQLNVGRFQSQTGPIGDYQAMDLGMGGYQGQQLGMGQYNPMNLNVGSYQGQGAQGISQYQGPTQIDLPEFRQRIAQIGDYNSQYNPAAVSNTYKPNYDPNSDKFAETFTKNLLARVTPGQEVDRKSMEAKLRLQGLQPGSEAYNRAYQNLLTSQGDVTAKAQLEGMLAGASEGRARSGEERNIAQELFRQQMGLAENERAVSGEQRGIYDLQLKSNLQRREDKRSNYQTKLQAALAKGQYAQSAYQTQLAGEQARGAEGRQDYSQQLQGELARGQYGQDAYQTQLQSALARQGAGRDEYNTALQSALQRGQYGQDAFNTQLQAALARGEAGRADYNSLLQGQLQQGQYGQQSYQTQLESALRRGEFDQEAYKTQFDAERARAEFDRTGQQQQWQQMMQQYMMPYDIADRQAQLIASSQGPGVNEYRPSFQNFTAAGQGQAANMMDAAQQSYAAQVQRANAAAQAQSQRYSTYGAIAGALIGTAAGGNTATGAAIGGAVGSSFSDQALKEEITVITDEEAYQAMLRLHPHSFAWPSGKRAAGLIAQEVQREFPHLVSKGPQGYLMIDYEAFTALLLGAFRHLARRNENGNL